MTPKYRIWDTYRISKTDYMVLNIDMGYHFLTEGPIPCYVTYDFTRNKVRTFSIEGIDRKTDDQELRDR